MTYAPTEMIRTRCLATVLVVVLATDALAVSVVVLTAAASAIVAERNNPVQSLFENILNMYSKGNCLFKVIVL